MSLSAILRAAPILTADDLLQPETVNHHEMYRRGVLKPLSGRHVSEIPEKA